MRHLRQHRQRRPAPTTAADAASDTITVNCGRLAITKTADAARVSAGDPIGYTVTVTNNGTGTAKGVIATDTLPTDAGLAWILDDNAGGLCSLTAGVVTCGPIDLVAGDGFSFHVTSPTTVATAAESPVTNEACVTTTNDGNGCSEDDVDVFLLTIDKTNDAPLETLELPTGSEGCPPAPAICTIDLPTADEGSTVMYTLTYTVGSSEVTDGVIVDELPDGVTYIAGSASSDSQFTFKDFNVTNAGALTWTAASVSENGTLTYKVKIDTGASKLAQPLENTATIVSAETEPDDAVSDVFVPVIPLEETAPPTDVLAAPAGPSAPGSSLLLVLAVLGGIVLTIGFVTPVPAVVRRRNRR